MADAASRLVEAMSRTRIGSNGSERRLAADRDSGSEDDDDDVIFLGETQPVDAAVQSVQFSDSDSDVEFVSLEPAADPVGRAQRLSAVEEVSMVPIWQSREIPHGVPGGSPRNALPYYHRTRAPVAPRTSPPSASRARRLPLPLHRSPGRPASAGLPPVDNVERHVPPRGRSPRINAPRRGPLPLVQTPSRQGRLRVAPERPTPDPRPTFRRRYIYPDRSDAPLLIVVPDSYSDAESGTSTPTAISTPDSDPEGDGDADGASLWGDADELSSPDSGDDDDDDDMEIAGPWDDVSSVSSPELDDKDDEYEASSSSNASSDGSWVSAAGAGLPFSYESRPVEGEHEADSSSSDASSDGSWMSAAEAGLPFSYENRPVRDNLEAGGSSGSSHAGSAENWVDAAEASTSDRDGDLTENVPSRLDAPHSRTGISRLPILPGRRRLAKMRHILNRRRAAEDPETGSSDGDSSAQGTFGDESPPSAVRYVLDASSDSDTESDEAGVHDARGAAGEPSHSAAQDTAGGQESDGGSSDSDGSQSLLDVELIPSRRPRTPTTGLSPHPAADRGGVADILTAARRARYREAQRAIAEGRRRREADKNLRLAMAKTEEIRLAVARAEADRRRRHEAEVLSSDDEEEGSRPRAERHCSLRHPPPSGINLPPGEPGSAWTRDGWARTGHLSSYLRRYRVVSHVPREHPRDNVPSLQGAYAALLSGRRQEDGVSVPSARELWAACRALDHTTSALLRPLVLHRAWPMRGLPLAGAALHTLPPDRAAELDRIDCVMRSVFYAMCHEDDARRRTALAWLLCRYTRAVHRARLADRLLRSIVYDDVLRALWRCGVDSVVGGTYRCEMVRRNGGTAMQQRLMPSEPSMSPLPRRRARYNAAQRQAADRALAVLDCVLEYLCARTGDGAVATAGAFVPAQHAVPLFVAVIEMDASVDGCGARRSLAAVARALLAHHRDAIVDGLRDGALLRRFPAATVELAGLLARSALTLRSEDRAVVRYACILFLSRDLAVPFPGAASGEGRPAEMETRDAQAGRDFALAVLRDLERGVQSGAAAETGDAERRWMWAMALGRACVALRLFATAFAYAGGDNGDMFSGGSGPPDFGQQVLGALDSLDSAIRELQVPADDAARVDALAALGSLKIVLSARILRRASSVGRGREEWLWH